MIDIILLLIFAVVTWSVASEGAWGAGLTCLCILCGGLLAMNFFEPVADMLERNVSSSIAWRYRWDSISLIGQFAVYTFLLRMATSYLTPNFLQMQLTLYAVYRWTAAALAGYITMAFLLTALHTTPLPREFIGFKPERANLFGFAAPDRQWLGFTQYVSERVFRRNHIFDGPRFKIGQQTNEVWPSFPIRYASRRDEIAGGGVESSASGEGGKGGLKVKKNGPSGKGRPDF